VFSPRGHRQPKIPAEVRLETAACPCGCPSDEELVLKGRDRLHDLPGEFQVVRCLSCGLMRTDPRPTPETISFYYPEDYGPYKETRVINAGAAQVQAPLWKRLARRCLQFNTQRLPDLPPGRMLEIGCASGGFLHKMAAAGWTIEGLEFSEKAAAAARALGYPVISGTLEAATRPADLYDLVVGWMVLEHLHDPQLALQKLHHWTRPDAWLVVSVPNAAALEFKVFRDAWYALHLPNHLFHYTPQTLARVLQLGGWRMEKVYHQRVLTNLLASVAYRVQDRRPDSRFARGLLQLATHRAVAVALYPLAFLFSLVGQTGRMTVWARRMETLPKEPTS
jgi:2-polyprenyl-3-methyl-5-hydroxy-6-metoxy-1,4-benzoquinol methylase